MHHPEIAKEFEKKTLSVKKLPEHARRKPRVDNGGKEKEGE